MKTQTRLMALLMIFIFIFYGCPDPDKDVPQPNTQVSINDATQVTETSFLISWSINKTNIKQINIELSLTDDFKETIKTITVPDPSMKSQLIDGLTGATKYYLRLMLTLDDNSTAESSTKAILTSHFHAPINATTVDGLKIAGSIHYLESNTTNNPGVLFMGVFSLSNHWGNEVVFLDLISKGYVCYKFDWRGHGGSDSWPLPITLDSLEVFVRKHAKIDMLACYHLLKNHEKVDSNRIALIGGSLGANETLNGNCWSGVKASVALSPSRLGLTGECPFKGAFFIACEDDKNSYINFGDEAEWLYDNALDPKKLLILKGDAHALEMLAFPGVNEEIIEWITTRMDNK